LRFGHFPAAQLELNQLDDPRVRRIHQHLALSNQELRTVDLDKVLTRFHFNARVVDEQLFDIAIHPCRNR
jgi:hypothetical protein